MARNRCCCLKPVRGIGYTGLSPVFQETMVAMECFFMEWFGTTEDNPWGRQPVSNDTGAIERAIREAQARTSRSDKTKNQIIDLN